MKKKSIFNTLRKGFRSGIEHPAVIVLICVAMLATIIAPAAGTLSNMPVARANDVVLHDHVYAYGDYINDEPYLADDTPAESTEPMAMESMGIAPLSLWMPEFFADSQAALWGYIDTAVSVEPYIVIEIEDGLDLTDTVYIPAGRNIVLVASTPVTLTVAGDFRHITVEGALTLTDNITLQGRGTGLFGGGVRVNDGGVFTMQGGTISGNI